MDIDRACDYCCLAGAKLLHAHAMRHGITQHGIDAGLPARACCFECVQHFGIHAHVQGRALDGYGWPAPASFDVGALPVSSHGNGFIRVIGAIGGGVGYRRIGSGFALDPRLICASGFIDCFWHTVPFLF